MYLVRNAVIVIFLFVTAGCGAQDEQARSDRDPYNHAWKDQTRALQKAREVDGLMQEQSERRRREIEKQGG